MFEILNSFGYEKPKIVCGNFGHVTVEQRDNMFRLKVNGEQWMAFDPTSHDEAYELFSHYHLATGHVICTGMGFGIRESWILTKPEVTKLTIVEKNPEVYEYHKQINSLFLSDPRVNVVIHDASKYKNTCDVLLLDHYEFLHHHLIIKDVQTIQNNINCNVMWFWPIELIIMRLRFLYMSLYQPQYIETLPALFHVCGLYGHDDKPHEKPPVNNFEMYQLLKNRYDLHKLPNLTKSQIDMFCMMWESKNFTYS